MRTAALLAALLGLTACGDAPTVETRLVLITLDTLRADGLGAMPRTRAFAERGLLFEQAYAATSTTQPTHASLFTGLHPWQHGVTRNGLVLAERHVTLAERLRAVGYETAGVAASFPMERRFGLAQGFARYRDQFTEPYVRSWEGETLEGGRFYSLHDDVTAAALEELDRLRSPRQFLWVHYFDPHDPYGDAAAGNDAAVIGIGGLLGAAASGDPRAPAAVARARELYDADVAALDRSLAALLERLEADDVPTLVAVTSDHGESFGEQGCLGHGKRLVPEQVRVPLFLWGSGVASGVRADAAGSVDVAATLLAAAGVDARTEGRDLLRGAGEAGLVVGMRRTFAEPRFEQLLDGAKLPIEGECFYVVRAGELLTGNALEVCVDDDRSRPVDDEGAESVRELFAVFVRLLEGAEAEELLDEEVQEALGALGYGR